MAISSPDLNIESKQLRKTKETEKIRELRGETARSAVPKELFHIFYEFPGGAFCIV